MFQVEVVIGNAISSIISTEQVKVMEKLVLTDIIIQYLREYDRPPQNTSSSSSSSYKTDAPINFTAVVLMGKTDTFQWIVNEDPVPDGGPSVVLPFARAGEYNITVTISGEAGTSLPVSRSIQVARPLTLDAVDLTLPGLIVWPPGHLEVVVYLSGPEELPTLVQGDVDWGDDLPATQLDLHSLTLPQAAGVVVHNVSHHYNWHGTFHLAFNFYNSVSRINLTREVRVVERLTLDYILVEYLWQDDAPPWPSTMFKAGVPLNLTAVVKTGKAASFNLFVGDKELTDNLPSIFHTFHSAGEYLANMTASGEAGVSPVLTASVVVIQPLSPHHLHLTLPDFVVVPPGNLTVQMVLSSKEAEELPSYVTYTVLWGDGSNTSLDDLMQDTQIGASGPVTRSLTHIYEDSGDFPLTWKAHNPVSEAHVTKTVRVIDHLTVGNILIDYLEESDRPLWDSPTFRSGVPLNITAVVLSGDVTSYAFYIEGQTITSTAHYISHTFFEAGEMMINMTTQGEAGVSPPASTTVTLEHPVQPHHLELTLNNLPVLPPGDADVTLTVANVEHLPTNLLGVFSWGDGQETPLDLTNNTTPESTGPVVVSLMHNYTSAGEYTGYLSMLNSVSRANLSITLRVLDHLTLEDLVVQYEGGGEGEGGVFRAGTPLTLTTGMTTGQADQFTLTLNGEIFSSNTPSFTYTFPRAGVFLASMEAAGTAGISRPITAWIKVLQPLREESATLEVPEKVLSPPGDANITVALSDAEELPTNVSGWVTWGDGDQAEEVGFLDITPPGAQGSVSHVLTHVYEEPGDYFVTWYIENKVSKLNLTKLVPVVQQLWLQGVQISVVGDDHDTERPEGFFFVGETIRLAPEKVYGEADSFTLSLIGQPDLVQDSPSFIISFKRESDYKYGLMGKGLGGTSNTLSGWVRVRNKQTPPNLKLSSPATRVGEQFPLTIHTSSFLGTCLSLDLGDGTLLGWRASAQCEGHEQAKVEWQAAPLSNTVKLKHMYTEPGTYNLVARLFSAMGEVVTRATVEVFGALPCSLFNVWVQKNGSVEAPVQMTRADKLWVRSFAEVNCSVLELNMKIKWKVERVNDSTEEELPGIDFSKSVLYLPGRTLPYGLYRAIVAYNVSMTNAKGLAVWAVLYGESVVEVGKSQLMVVIVKGGAPRIRRGTLNTLILNPGQISYDPDYPERPLISYTWSCHLEGEELPDEEVISDPPESREAYEGKTDQGGCWGEGPGWLTNAAPDLTLPVDLFRSPYKTYSLQVVANSSDGRQNRAKVEVEVVEGDPPTLVSGCSPAWFCRQIQGAQLVNPAKLILHSTCEVMPGEEKVGEDGCGHTPLLYSWRVSGVPPSGEEPVPLDISGVSAGENMQKLALLDDFWKKFGTRFRMFDVQVTAQRSGETAQGLALQRIQINEAPHGGECYARIGEEENQEGGLVKRSQEVPTLVVTALVETVLCNCTGWKDPEGFEVSKYAFFVMDDLGTKMILAFGSQSVGRVVLPFANLTLWAGVSDQMGAETLFHMANIVPLLPTRDAFNEYKAKNELTKALSVVDQTRVDMLLRAENSLMGISLPLHDYEDASSKGEQDIGEEEEGEDVAAEKNTMMLGSVDKFSTTSMDEVIQVNNILGSISYPLPDERQGPAVDVLVALSGLADKEAPLSQQQDFVAGTLATTVSLMKGVNKMAQKSNATKTKPPEPQGTSTLRRVKRMAVNDSFYDEEAEEEVELYQPSPEDLEANEKVTKMLGVVGASQGALIQAAVVGEEPARIDAGENVNMAVGFFDANELKGRSVEVGGAVYVFPSYCAVLGEPDDCLTNRTVTIGVQMTKWKGAVHGYGGGREQLSNDSATVQLSLVDANSQPIPVNNSLEDFIMYIPRSEETSVEPTLVEPQVSSRMALSLHNLHVPAPRVAVTVLVRPENETEGEDWVLAWSSSTMNDSFEYADNLVYLNNLTYHSDTGFYELFLDSDVVGDTTGTYTFGIGRYNRTLAVPQEHPCFEDPPPDTYLFSYHTNFSSPYYFSTFVSSCLFFDNERLTWSSDGCTVMAANSSITVCACNHLTSFGSGFFVTPNTIDFSYVFANAGFVDNLTIYLTLIITLGLYFIGLVYARIMDKKDLEKIGATPLSDNNPNDHYLYILIVHTGQVPNSGTKSKVQFLMVGDWDETDVRTLNDEKRPLLRRGGTDHFVMATEKPLGPLQYLRIWHDNSGKGKEASWFFSYMVVRDVQNGEEFQFINNEWLAVEEGDGQVDRLVAVAGEQQLKDYSHVFGKTVQKNFADDHLWFSIFLRSPRSRFTRVQRLSACMALLYLSMLANAMFYEKMPEEPGSGGLRLGPVSVSPQALGIGFISNLVVFPPSFCIVFFFRKSRPRRPKESRLKEALRKQSASYAGQFQSNDRRRTKPKAPTAPTVAPFRHPRSGAGRSGWDAVSGGSRMGQMKRRKKLSLPWWCVLVAWTLCVISIAVAVFFLWAYGVQFGNDKATKWLTALLSSIFSSILFTQPIKIYLMAMVLSWILKKPLDEFEDYDDDEEEFDLEGDGELLYGPPSAQAGSRRRSQIQVGAGLSHEELTKAKQKRMNELAMQDLLVEVLVYLMFLLIIISISHGDRDPNIFYMRENIKNTFALASQSQCPAFVQAQQESHFWCWIQETMVPSLLDTTLYNGVHRPQDMCGTMIDRITFVLGYPIIRQIRRKPGNTETHPATHRDSEEKRDFGMYWNESGAVESVFQYRSALEIHGFPYDGTLDTYGGGGYLVEMKGPQAKVLRTLASLHDSQWVDDGTKALFVEFAVYNPQVNLFAVTMFVFEFLPGGGLLTKFEFQALKLLRYHEQGGAFVLAVEIVYILFSLFYTRREFKTMKKQGWKYFKSVWNLMEVWVLALSYTAIVFYLLKTSLTYYLLDKFIETKGKKYIKIQPLAFLDSILVYVIAFQVFIATLKLLRLLRFNRRIGMLSATLRYASGDIIGFGLIFFVTLISFVTVFYLSAMTSVKDFSSFIKAAESSFFLINQKFDEITHASPVLGPAFYFVFAFIMYWIVFQLLIAIVCHAFAKVSQDITKQPNDYEIVEYIMNKISAYITALRPNSVQEVSIPPPKPPDIESQLRYLSASLDKAMGVLECEVLKPEKKTVTTKRRHVNKR
ncbi:uncharacterized protein LOC135088742 isoform X2 [Scylla paramamosain]